MSPLIQGKGETILLADDEADVREVIDEVLTSLGYSILLAVDGKEAVELFKANISDISLVIMDFEMPRMGGVEAAKQMRQLDSEMPVIFATGHDKEQSATSGEEVEGSIIISKPFPFADLSRTMRKAIDARNKP